MSDFSGPSFFRSFNTRALSHGHDPSASAAEEPASATAATTVSLWTSKPTYRTLDIGPASLCLALEKRQAAPPGTAPNTLTHDPSDRWSFHSVSRGRGELEGGCSSPKPLCCVEHPLILPSGRSTINHHPSTPEGQRPSRIEWLAAIAVSVGLVLLFWWDICPWNGGTLIGGDLFSYFFPQKAFLSDALRSGEFPLWNNRVGAGYPVIAESQTGVLYPPTLLLFATLDLNAAYHANQLLHYVVAFIGFWAYARWMGIRWWGATLAAVIYVYGWFAPRICLEWAIIGGAWMPWIFWVVEEWFQSGNRRCLLWLAPLMGGFLLAGHFHLAFITTLGLGLYVPGRMLWGLRSGEIAPGFKQGWVKRAGWPLGVLILGYLIASIQLVPTLELMSRSQRSSIATDNDPGYGHIPPWYLSQVLSLWMWNGPDMNPDVALFQGGGGAYPVATNRAEAQLYFGMVPLLLCGLAVVHRLRGGGQAFDARILLWLGIGLIGVVLATGWPFLVLKHVPGFAYFRGAGRYGVLMAIAVALFAGDALQRLFSRSGVTQIVCSVIAISLTIWDFHTITPLITYTTQLQTSVVAARDFSSIGHVLRQTEAPLRLWAPGQNAPTILPVSAYPVYLGLGPRDYFDPEKMSTFDAERDGANPLAIAQHLDWLRANGVTHLMSFTALASPAWSELHPVALETDPFFAAVWGRFQEPLFLYRLQPSTEKKSSVVGRVVRGTGDAVTMTDFEEESDRVSFEVNIEAPSVVTLRDLAYPGWEVTVDGKPASPSTTQGMYRGVEVPTGQHRIEWSYRPRSLLIGAIGSLVAILIWGVVYYRASSRSSAPL